MDLIPGQVDDRAKSRNRGIVVHHDLTGAADMDVELDSVGPEPDGGPKGGQGILDLDPGGAPMGKDLDKSPYVWKRNQ